MTHRCGNVEHCTMSTRKCTEHHAYSDAWVSPDSHIDSKYAVRL